MHEVPVHELVTTYETNFKEKFNKSSSLRAPRIRGTVENLAHELHDNTVNANYESSFVHASGYQLDAIKNRMNSLNKMLEKEKANKKNNAELNSEIDKFNADLDGMTNEDAAARFNNMRAKYNALGIVLNMPTDIFGKDTKNAFKNALARKQKRLYNSTTLEELEGAVKKVTKRYNELNRQHDVYNEKARNALDKVENVGIKASEKEEKAISRLIENRMFRSKSSGNRIRNAVEFIDINKYNDNNFVKTELAKLRIKPGSHEYDTIMNLRKMKYLRKIGDSISERIKSVTGKVEKTSAEYKALRKNTQELQISSPEVTDKTILESIKTVNDNKFSILKKTLTNLEFSTFDIGEADPKVIQKEFNALFVGNNAPKNEEEFLNLLNTTLYAKYPIFVNSIKNKLRDGEFQGKILNELEETVKGNGDLSTEEKSRQLDAIVRFRETSAAAKYLNALKFNLNEQIDINPKKISDIIKKLNESKDPAEKINLPFNEAKLTPYYETLIKKTQPLTLEEREFIKEYESMKNAAIKTTKRTLNMTDAVAKYIKHYALLNTFVEKYKANAAYSELANITFSKSPSQSDLINVKKVLDVYKKLKADDLEKSFFDTKNRNSIAINVLDPAGKGTAKLDEVMEAFNFNEQNPNQYANITEHSLLSVPKKIEIVANVDAIQDRQLKDFLSNMETTMANRKLNNNTSVGEKIDIDANTAKYGAKMGAVVTYANLFRDIVNPVNVEFQLPASLIPRGIPVTDLPEAKDHFKALIKTTALNPMLKASLKEYIDSIRDPLQIEDETGTMVPAILTTADGLQQAFLQTVNKFNTEKAPAVKQAILVNFGLPPDVSPSTVAIQLESLKTAIKGFDIRPTTLSSSDELKSSLEASFAGNNFIDEFHNELYIDAAYIDSILAIPSSNIATLTPDVSLSNIYALEKALADIIKKRDENKKKIGLTKDPSELDKSNRYEAQYKAVIEKITTQIKALSAVTGTVQKYAPFLVSDKFEQRFANDIETEKNTAKKTAINDAKAALEPISKYADEAAYTAAINGIADLSTNLEDLTKNTIQIENLYRKRVAEEFNNGLGNEYSTYLYNRYLRPAELFKGKILDRIKGNHEAAAKEIETQDALVKAAKVDVNEEIKKINEKVLKYNRIELERAAIAADVDTLRPKYNTGGTDNNPDAIYMLDVLNGATAGAGAAATEFGRDIRNINLVRDDLDTKSTTMSAATDLTDPTFNSVKATTNVITALKAFIETSKKNKGDDTEFTTKKTEMLGKIHEYLKNDATGTAFRALYEAAIDATGGRPYCANSTEFLQKFGLVDALNAEKNNDATNKKLIEAFKAAKCFNLNNANNININGIDIHLLIGDITGVALPTAAATAAKLFTDVIAEALQSIDAVHGKVNNDATNLTILKELSEPVDALYKSTKDKASVETEIKTLRGYDTANNAFTDATLNALKTTYRLNQEALYRLKFDPTTGDPLDIPFELKTLDASILSSSDDLSKQYSAERSLILQKVDESKELKDKKLGLLNQKFALLNKKSTYDQYINFCTSNNAPTASLAPLSNNQVLQNLIAKADIVKTLDISSLNESTILAYNGTLPNSPTNLPNIASIDTTFNTANTILGNLVNELYPLKAKATLDDVKLVYNQNMARVIPVNEEFLTIDQIEAINPTIIGSEPSTATNYDSSLLTALIDSNATTLSHNQLSNILFNTQKVVNLAGGAYSNSSSRMRALTKLRKRARSMTRNKHVREHKKSVIRSDKKKAYKTKRA